MSEPAFRWTSSQKQAFAYVQSGVERKMSATGALKEYRSGGGKIRDAYWFSMFKAEFNLTGVKERIEEIPMTYNVPETMFEPTDFDYRAKYIMSMKVSGYSEELGTRITKYVTVESDEILTKAEWRWGAQQAVDRTLGSPVFVLDKISEYTPRIRVR